MNRTALGFIMLISNLTLAARQNPGTPRTLSVAEARQLVENVPEIRRARDQYRRPEISGPPMDSTANTLSFQARSMMTKGTASGLIGNYQVDRRTGRVSRDVGNKKEEVRSYLVQSLRQQFMSASQGTRPELGIRSENLLQNIAQSKNPVGYSLWGIELGSRLDPARMGSVRTDKLTPDPGAGQMLSGFKLRHSSNTRMPLIEAYTGPDDSVVELYVEVAVERDSFDALFGTAFTDDIIAADAEKWKAMLGDEVLVRQKRFNNVNALFADVPSKGFSACVYRRTVAGGTVYVDPIFVDFYIPAQSPKGETLSESASRRAVSCLRERGVLDEEP